MPAEWAGQDLAGRDEAESLEGLLSGTGGMSDGLNGWFVFAIGHGVGGADTYVYRTRDGGRTWQETGRPDPARMMWYPSYTYFIDSYTGFLGQSYFNDAPIFRTTDGGLTWEEITLPLAGEWELSSMCASGSDVLMLLTGYSSNSLSNAVLYSGDRGETWERLALPADASGWADRRRPPAWGAAGKRDRPLWPQPEGHRPGRSAGGVGRRAGLLPQPEL